MDVTVRTYQSARATVGRKELMRELEAGATVGDLLADLEREFGLVPEEATVMKNGRNVRQLDGRETALTDGDALAITIEAMNE